MYPGLVLPMLIAVVFNNQASAIDPNVISPKHTLTIAEIVKAWQSRSDSVRTLRIKWETKTTFERGCFINEDVEELLIPKGRVYPPKQITFRVPEEMVIEHDDLRRQFLDFDVVFGDFSTNSKNGAFVKRDGLIPQDRTYVSTPNGFKQIIAEIDVDPQGLTTPNKSPKEVINDPRLAPVLMAFRFRHPFLTWFDDMENRYHVLPNRQVLGGKSCIQIKSEKEDSEGSSFQFWLDPEREFITVRMSRILSNGKADCELDIEEYKRVDSVWIPVKWTMKYFNDMGLLQSEWKTTVGEFHINDPIDRRLFELAFRPLMYLKDEWKDPPANYFIEADGTYRLSAFEELIDSDQKHEPHRDNEFDIKDGRNIVIAIICLMVLSLGSFYFLRRK